MSVTDHEMPAVPADEAVDEAAMQDWAELLVERARSEGVELGGIEILAKCQRSGHVLLCIAVLPTLFPTSVWLSPCQLAAA